MTDYYLADKSRLNGQPKKTIGDYVASQGILVPRRFDTLHEARASGLPILCRSEHEQEYDGVSGLLYSPPLDSLVDTNDEQTLKEEALVKSRAYVGEHISDYCRFLKINEEKFKAEISFSFWQKMEGINITVIADTAIKERYHIMSLGQGGAAYTIFERGKPTILHQSGPMRNTRDQLQNLLHDYEAVRNLEKFDPDTCPIMEFQTVGGKNYFLQYHQGREFQEANFTINPKNLQGKEKRTMFVRGATTPEGRTYTVALVYPESWKESHLPEREDGFYGHYEDLWSEMMASRWNVRAIPATGSLSFTL